MHACEYAPTGSTAPFDLLHRRHSFTAAVTARLQVCCFMLLPQKHASCHSGLCSPAPHSVSCMVRIHPCTCSAHGHSTMHVSMSQHEVTQATGVWAMAARHKLTPLTESVPHPPCPSPAEGEVCGLACRLSCSGHSIPVRSGAWSVSVQAAQDVTVDLPASVTAAQTPMGAGWRQLTRWSQVWSQI